MSADYKNCPRSCRLTSETPRKKRLSRWSRSLYGWTLHGETVFVGRHCTHSSSLLFYLYIHLFICLLIDWLIYLFIFCSAAPGPELNSAFRWDLVGDNMSIRVLYSTPSCDAPEHCVGCVTCRLSCSLTSDRCCLLWPHDVTPLLRLPGLPVHTVTDQRVIWLRPSCVTPQSVGVVLGFLYESFEAVF